MILNCSDRDDDLRAATRRIDGVRLPSMRRPRLPLITVDTASHLVQHCLSHENTNASRVRQRSAALREQLIA